jgi:hypothetical protein
MGRGLAERRFQLQRAKARAGRRLRWLLAGRQSQTRGLFHFSQKSGYPRSWNPRCALACWLAAVRSGSITPAHLGKRAVTPALCSCWRCGNRRRYFGKAAREKKDGRGAP